jgi:uncharacterized protein (UPF0147 family)
MAAIQQSLVKDAGVPVNLTRLAMSASDTLTYNKELVRCWCSTTQPLPS